MLGTVVAAGLAPTIGAVAAQSNCEYNSCTSGSSTPFPWWIVAAVLAVVVVAALIGLMLLRRRPPSGTSAPAAWQPPSGATGPGGPMPPSAAPAAAMVGGTAAAAASRPSYVETAEDVGQIPPAAGTGAAGEAEPDIDSLMAELDKISGEILKKAPKTGSGGSGASDTTVATDR